MLLDVWILGLICAMRKTDLTRLQVALQTGSVPKRAVRTLVDIRRRHYCDNANGGVCLVHVWSNLDEFVKNGDTHSNATQNARKLATVGRSLMKSSKLNRFILNLLYYSYKHNRPLLLYFKI